MFTYKINGYTYQSEKAISILEASKGAGMNIPNLCYLKEVGSKEHCKLCVCQVVGREELVFSCNTLIQDNMEILTMSKAVRDARKRRLEEILSTHDTNCTSCSQTGNCLLQTYTQEFGADPGAIQGEIPREIDDSNPFYIFDSSKCVGCDRCVNLCKYIQGDEILQKYTSKELDLPKPIATQKRGESDCVSCGNCVQICPTAALSPKKGRYSTGYEKAVKTVCPYCGVGCNINLQVTKYNKISGITGTEQGLNHGLLCVKGRFAYDFITHPNRLKTPQIRKNGVLTPCSWEEAYDAIIQALREAISHGGDKVAGLASARCTNEDNYVFQKFLRIAGKTNHIDHCARLCHASTVTGLANSFGSGAMTGSICDVDKSDLIFVTGSNTTATHPVIGSMILQAVSKGSKLLVAEPREIDLCKHATCYLQIRPGTNVALINGMMKVILEENLENTVFIEASTEGFSSLVQEMKHVDVSECARICGILEKDLRQAALLYGKANLASIYYAMGVTQHSTGTEGVMSIANLAMLCGQIGKPGNGVHPLRGQNNVQGSCDMGALPTDFPGYQKIANPAALEKFSSLWDETLSDAPGKTSTQIIDGLYDGSIEFLYIMGENPMVSDPDLNHTKKAFEKAKFIVCADIFPTETTEFAHVVLPAFVYAEKEGTFTNTERRVQLIQKAVVPPENTKGDWQMICEIAQKMNLKGFDFKNSEEIMEEIALAVPSYGGISYERIREKGLQWPCPNKEHPGTPILHKDGNFTRGKGQFIPISYKPSAEVSDEQYPLTLTTGRVLSQYHTRTMSGKTPAVECIAGTSFVEIHPSTASKYHITDGMTTSISSPRGTILAAARVTDRIGENVVFIPFHYGENPANILTAVHLDPYAKIPELKVSKVKISPFKVGS